jgi:hypothetical protein
MVSWQWLAFAFVVILLAMAGGWLWQTANTGLAVIETEVGAAVNADLWPATQRLAAAELRDLDGETAVVNVALPAEGAQPALRQTQVYRQTERGWVRTAPAAADWGALGELETNHLLFRYYAHDAQAVAEVAVKLDARYAELHQLFLGQPPTRPLMVVVDPAQAPGQIATRAGVADPLVVASPAVHLAPASISDADLLAQSLLLALLDDLTAQALLPYVGGSDEQTYVQWMRVRKLLEGMRLWQLWQGALPLAAWREPVVRWVFSDARPWLPAPSEVAPSFRAEFCAMHRLWLPTPFELDLPLSCNDSMDTEGYALAWRLAAEPPLRLAHFPLVTLGMALEDFDASPSGWAHPAAAVALATVMDYAAATYGPERIPVLIREASSQEGWTTLIPAVFGVPVEEFEVGWRGYLVERYAITLPPAG